MTCYIFSQEIRCIQNGKYNAMRHEKIALYTTADWTKYIVTDLLGIKEVRDYKKIGVTSNQLLGMYRFFTDHHAFKSCEKVEDKLGELRDILRYTSTAYSESEIELIKDNCVIATVLLDEKNKDCFWGICYFDALKLLRMEIYADGILYANHYVTADSGNGLYAKLAKRVFYNQDASVAYEQIFEDEKEWFLFPNGKCFTKQELMVEFVKRLKLSEQDIVLLDASVSDVFMKAIFTFGKVARIVALTHVGRNFVKSDSPYVSVGALWRGYFYEWFPYVEMLDTMVVSSEEQRQVLTKELQTYHCHIPDIKAVPMVGEFTYTVLRESYGGNLALSWVFTGKADVFDGFLVYDEFGTQLCETKNVHQHYFLITDSYEQEIGFVLKAFVETIKGKMVVAESERISLSASRYEEPVISLIMPAYNAEDYIVRSVDTALAQSFSDLEIIIVDDGSTDHTSEIVDWYAGNYANVTVMHQKNGGVSAARNTGMRYANGDYIAFMDSDDMVRPNMVIRLHDSAEKNNCDIAMTSFFWIANDGYKKILQYSVQENTAITMDDFFNKLNTMGWGYMMVVWNKLYKASLVRKRLFPSISYEDSAWMPYVMSYAKSICYLDDCSYEYDRMIRNGTLVDEYRSNKSVGERFQDDKRIVEFYLKNGNPDKIDILKEHARQELNYSSDLWKCDAYDEFWQQIDETF